MKKSFSNWVKTPVARAVSLATLTTLATCPVLTQETDIDNKNEEVNEVSQKGNDEDIQDDNVTVNKIIVTASKRPVDMQELPQSIQAIGNEQIERMGLRNFEDYSRAVPSLSTVTPSPGRNEIVFRGISTGSDGWRTDASAAVYLDEIPMTSAAQQADPRMVDIERIEALPGPQGTLLGSSSQSGAIRIITNKPDAEHGVFGSVEGEFSKVSEGDTSHRLEGHVNIPIIDDKLAVRIAGFSVHEGGYIDNVLGTALFTDETNADVVKKDFNTWDLEGFRIIGLWHVNDKWDAQLTLMQQKSETNGDWKYDPAVGELEIVRFHNDYRTDDWFTSALTITGDLGFAQLSYSTSKTKRDIFYEWDSMVDEQLTTHHKGRDIANNGYYALAYYDFDYKYGSVINDQIGRRTTHEIRLSSQGDSKFQWLLGAFYEDNYDAWDWHWQIPGLVDTPAWGAFNYWAYYASYYNIIAEYPLTPTDIYYQEDFKRDNQTDSSVWRV